MSMDHTHNRKLQGPSARWERLTRPTQTLDAQRAPKGAYLAQDVVLGIVDALGGKHQPAGAVHLEQVLLGILQQGDHRQKTRQ